MTESIKLEDGPTVKDGKYLDNEGLTEHEKFVHVCRAFLNTGIKLCAFATLTGKQELVSPAAVAKFVDDAMVDMVAAGVLPNIVEKNTSLIN